MVCNGSTNNTNFKAQAAWFIEVGKTHAGHETRYTSMSTVPEGDRLYRMCVNFKALSLMSSLGATTDFGGDLFLPGSPLMTWGPLSRVKEANDALHNQNSKSSPHWQRYREVF